MEGAGARPITGTPFMLCQLTTGQLWVNLYVDCLVCDMMAQPLKGPVLTSWKETHHHLLQSEILFLCQFPLMCLYIATKTAVQWLAWSHNRSCTLVTCTCTNGKTQQPHNFNKHSKSMVGYFFITVKNTTTTSISRLCYVAISLSFAWMSQQLPHMFKCSSLSLS